MNYSEWEECVFSEIKTDIVWKIEAYRLSLYLSDLSWKDASLISSALPIRWLRKRQHY